MDDTSLMHVFTTSYELVHEEAVVRVRQVLRRLDDAMEVAIQELHGYIQSVFPYVAE